MPKTNIEGDSIDALGKVWLLAFAVFSPTIPVHAQPSPELPLQCEERLSETTLANDMELRRWLDVRQRDTGVEIQLPPICRRPGGGPELYRKLWVQRIFDAIADEHGPKVAWELIANYAYLLNGDTTTGFKAVGALLWLDKEDNPLNQHRLLCAGTLVGPRHFITARHCPSKPTKDLRVYMQHEGLLKVSKVVRYCDPPQGTECADSSNVCDCYTDDLAILELEDPVLSVHPMPVTPADGTQSTGSGYQIVGFGVFNKSPDGLVQLDYAGIKYYGADIQDATCPEPEDPARTICYAIFPVGDGKPTSCNRDSGGPVMSDSSPAEALLGIARTGGNSCEQGFSRAVRLEHSSYYQWLSASFDLSTANFPSYAVMPGGEYSFPEGELLLGSSKSSKSIGVQPGADLLLVTLNHETHLSDPEMKRFELRVLDPLGNDRCYDAIGPFAECRVGNPEAGEWRIEVHPMNGVGLFQLTAQVLKETSPPRPPVVDVD